ncbi:hypothetical protein [Nonlabens ponticola]|uniref:Uncharacterized protein n=1 Tax=Nonlabens ponticola TaxID=2496866 RepID=A0A3S9MZ43_9FLAO|nr:hypothetical protein [Nonlabens ponticola]AZQ44404.1 hypothetical protein EJ995_09180 [Nonlabens ponticola]
MDHIYANLYLYVIFGFMLLGAFILGYVSSRFNARNTNEQSVSFHTGLDKDIINADVEREISKIVQPGSIRAQRTRDRSGILSDDAKRSMIENQIDFESIGTGNAADKDDLQQITGIGPFVEEKLNAIGIYNFSQLARMSDEDINAIAALIEFFPGRIQRDEWKEQAQALSKD